MTATTVPGLDQAPTRHRRLREWAREVAELQLVDAGTFVRLAEDAKPNS
jgi:phosphoenolpyruvate carboxykinase (GTP)